MPLATTCWLSLPWHNERATNWKQNIATRKIGLKSAILKRIDLQQNGGPHVPTVLKLVGKMKFLIMIVLYKSKVLTLLVEVLM